jgi:hypothetical protein
MGGVYTIRYFRGAPLDPPPSEDPGMILFLFFSSASTQAFVETVGVFCTSKIQGRQDHAFQFQDGLANYKTHGDLSWIRPPYV